jgi:hypothetical protein
VADSCNQQFVDAVMKDERKIDTLFVDSLHTRAQVTRELFTWLPFLSDKCIIFFHDTVWCHDTVKVLIDDILENFKVYKFCKNFDEKRSVIDRWCKAPAAVGIQEGRPIVQSVGEIVDAPEYAKDRKIVSEDYFEDEKRWSQKAD